MSNEDDVLSTPHYDIMGELGLVKANLPVDIKKEVQTWDMHYGTYAKDPTDSREEKLVARSQKIHDMIEDWQNEEEEEEEEEEPIEQPPVVTQQRPVPKSVPQPVQQTPPPEPEPEEDKGWFGNMFGG